MFVYFEKYDKQNVDIIFQIKPQFSLILIFATSTSFMI
jgi:hypothetical protein